MNGIIEDFSSMVDNDRELKSKLAIHSVCESCGINKRKIKKNGGRKREIVQGRNMICNILYHELSLTLVNIADIMGYKTHSSVLHGISMHNVDSTYDKMYKRKYEDALAGLELKINKASEFDFDETEKTLKRFFIKVSAIENRLNNVEKLLTN